MLTLHVSQRLWDCIEDSFKTPQCRNIGLFVLDSAIDRDLPEPVEALAWELVNNRMAFTVGHLKV